MTNPTNGICSHLEPFGTYTLRVTLRRCLEKLAPYRALSESRRRRAVMVFGRIGQPVPCSTCAIPTAFVSVARMSSSTPLGIVKTRPTLGRLSVTGASRRYRGLAIPM